MTDLVAEILSRHGPPTHGDPTRCRACSMLLPCDAIRVVSDEACLMVNVGPRHVYQAPGIYHECNVKDCNLDEQLAAAGLKR